MTTDEVLLRVEGLSVGYRSRRDTVNAVRDVSFTVAQGETVALVGGSGSGKSTTAHSIVRLLPPTAMIGSGRIQLDGDELTTLRPRALRSVRGRRIGLIPQDPAVSLNPVMRIGRQVAEVLLLHALADRRNAPVLAVEALAAAGLDQPSARARQYPHELSGGMRQRVLIAIALVARPSLVIADEATSALDVTVQRQVLDHLETMTRELGTSVLMITHDLGVAADRADRILVMDQGSIVETGTPDQVLRSPEHPYTKSLIQAAPSLAAVTARPRSAVPVGSAAAVTRAEASRPATAALEAEHLVRDFQVPGAAGGKTTFRAVDDVSLSVAHGETLGLVGESGSGKTTVARILLRLVAPTSGRVLIDGQDVTQVRGERLRKLRQEIQYVFQNPYTSLNPKMTVGDIVAEPLRSFGVGGRAEQRPRAVSWLDRVGLPASAADRRPAELSGGQRQRVAIARALVIDPRLVVLDEPVSALDVLIQAQILSLLASLQQEFGVSYLFISHDLAVIRRIAHRVSVMSHGQVVEEGLVDQVLDRPRHDYTRQLVEAIPGSKTRTPHSLPARSILLPITRSQHHASRSPPAAVG
ncbi:MAG: ABC transporter ATP-binding protein [Trebonia sp.]|jgi:peptide/nickel transport system ATP-binding protein